MHEGACADCAVQTQRQCSRVNLCARAQAALEAAHQAAEEVLQHAERRHAEALVSICAARDDALQRFAATEAEFRQALQARRASRVLCSRCGICNVDCSRSGCAAFC